MSIFLFRIFLMFSLLHISEGFETTVSAMKILQSYESAKKKHLERFEQLLIERAAHAPQPITISPTDGKSLARSIIHPIKNNVLLDWSTLLNQPIHTYCRQTVSSRANSLTAHHSAYSCLNPPILPESAAFIGNIEGPVHISSTDPKTSLYLVLTGALMSTVFATEHNLIVVAARDIIIDTLRCPTGTRVSLFSLGAIQIKDKTRCNGSVSTTENLDEKQSILKQNLPYRSALLYGIRITGGP